MPLERQPNKVVRLDPPSMLQSKIARARDALAGRMRAAHAAHRELRERYWRPTAALKAEIDEAEAGLRALYAESARAAAAERAGQAAAYVETDVAGRRRNDDGSYAVGTLDFTGVLFLRAERALDDARAAAASAAPQQQVIEARTITAQPKPTRPPLETETASRSGKSARRLHCPRAAAD